MPHHFKKEESLVEFLLGLIVFITVPFAVGALIGIITGISQNRANENDEQVNKKEENEQAAMEFITYHHLTKK